VLMSLIFVTLIMRVVMKNPHTITKEGRHFA
jgi:hypothetical protein